MDGTYMDRRTLLKTLGTVAVGVGLGAGCSVRPTSRPMYRGRHIMPARVSPDRVIRTVVGLRPFRPSGFVVRTESLNEKTVVHNYGHGGGGMTLSWGTAHLAMEEALQTGKKSCAVIGCGAVGLATARLMQRQGWQVNIYSKALPPQTTSNISGAQWSPSSVMDPGKTTPAYDDQFARAMRLSYRYFQDLVGDYYGVRWASNYILRNEPRRPGGYMNKFPDLFPEIEIIPPGEHPFHTTYALHFDTMFIEPPIYLNAMMRDYRIAGGQIMVRAFQNRNELSTLQEPVIINCTGLGARDLFNDQELMPIKGQLTVLLPQSEIDYLLIHRGLYMFPRRDGILLGGTHERGNWTRQPDRKAEQEIIAGHMDLFNKMKR